MSLAMPVKIFATTGSEYLARGIYGDMHKRLPPEFQPNGRFKLGENEVVRFSNGNLQVKVDDVRDRFAVVVHTQVPSVNDNLIELFALLDALRGAHAGEILVVFPYMPYSRSDKKDKPRISTMAHRLARILNLAFRIERVLLLDPHDEHIKHYFDPAADEISATFFLVDYWIQNVFPLIPRSDTMVVFPDSGSARRFKHVPKLLRVKSAYVDKERIDDQERPLPKEIVGDTRGMHCLLVDDEILTGKTMLEDAETLLLGGANSVSACAVHAPLDNKNSSEAEVVALLENSAIDRLLITDSIPVSHKLEGTKKFTVLSVVPFLAEAVKRTVFGGGLSELHELGSVDIYRP